MQGKKETKTTAPVVKAEVKEAEKTVEVKEAAPKACAKKAAEPKKAAKAPAAPKKAETEVKMMIQYQSNDSDLSAIEEKIKAQFAAEGHRVGTIKKLDIYIKPEDYSAYYVINDKFSGRVDLF